MGETVNNLELKANNFVMEYKDSSDEEISKIVAGMVAIIEGNEAAYERMKNQKWFERIWYGLTLKNKATVKEMRERREELTEFTVKILVRMNTILANHGRCIFDLYRAVAVIRRNIDVLTDQVTILAKNLNEKIESVDQYYFLINEIKLHKFNTDTPLLSLISIMSFVDSRTSKEKAKLIQLKETMEAEGFDFSRKIKVSDYANEVLSLQEESVGRILLFCQCFANKSRFLAFTCSLMENYYYQWDSERRLLKLNGEAVSEALQSNNLHDSDTCIVGDLFDDLMKALPDEFDAITTSSIDTFDYSALENKENEDDNQKRDDDTTYKEDGVADIIQEQRAVVAENNCLSHKNSMEGTYYICNAKNNSRFLQISNGKVTVGPKDNSDYQKWIIENVGGDNFAIKNCATSECLSLKNNVWGSPILSQLWINAEKQKWRIINENGAVTFVSGTSRAIGSMIGIMDSSNIVKNGTDSFFGNQNNKFNGARWILLRVPLVNDVDTDEHADYTEMCGRKIKTKVEKTDLDKEKIISDYVRVAVKRAPKISLSELESMCENADE